MIGHAIIYGIAFTCNCVLVSGTIISPLMKVDPGSTFDLFKSGDSGVPINEYDYAIVKRGAQETQESPDSKERRSHMGSSFIRFGRRSVEGKLENADYPLMNGDVTGNELDSRMARGRSDVIIRFGRSGLKNFRGGGATVVRQINMADLFKLLGYGNNNNRHPKLLSQSRQSLERTNDLERVTIVCSNVLASYPDDSSSVGDSGVYFYGKLYRLCNSLALAIDENDENNQRVVRNKIIEIFEDNASQAESIKRE